MPEIYLDVMGGVRSVRVGPTYWGIIMQRRPLELWVPGAFDKMFEDCTFPDKDNPW